MKLRTISVFLALCLLFSCILTPAFAEDATVPPENSETDSTTSSVMNSDVEAFENDWCYTIDIEGEGLIYRELIADEEWDVPPNREYITDFPVEQILIREGKLYYSIGTLLRVMELATGRTADLVIENDNILRFSLLENRLFYLISEKIYVYDMTSSDLPLLLLEKPGIDHFWLESPDMLSYMVGDELIYHYDFNTGNITVTDPNYPPPDSMGDGSSPTGMDLASLRNKFPPKKYWNHMPNRGTGAHYNNQDSWTDLPCYPHGSYCGTSKQTCNGFAPSSWEQSWQCAGYAEKCAYDMTGYNPIYNSNGWTTYTSPSALDKLKAGDIVRYKNNRHSIYVTGVQGDTVTYTDCNSDGQCVIRWDATISKSTLKASFSYIRSAPFPASYQVDDRYPTPFQAYTLSTMNLVCYESINGKEAGKIFPTDECTIKEIYTNNWCKVLCPWGSKGVLKTVYARITDFIYDTSYPLNNHTILTKTQGYTKNDMKTKFATINGGGYFYRVGKADGKTQILFYTDAAGWRLMWITHPGDKISGLNIGNNFYAYITHPEQGHFLTEQGKNVSLEKGLTKESQIWSFVYLGKGYYKILNCNNGLALTLPAGSSSGATVTLAKADGSNSQSWMICSTNTDGVITLEPMSNDLFVLHASNKGAAGTLLQCRNYNDSESQHFSLQANLSFTIRYDANGGSNAPEAHTNKAYLSTLTLSTQKPVGKTLTLSYNANGGTVEPKEKKLTMGFRKWNTQTDGEGYSYYPGGSYTVRGNETLYAQWDPAAIGTLPTPTRKNYTFLGWFTHETDGEKVTDGTAISQNTTIYAHWSAGCTQSHDYGHQVTTTPTTSNGGKIYIYCRRCPFSTTINIPALNENDYTYTVVKAPTCPETGIGRYTWKDTTYGEIFFEVTLDKTSHNYKITVVAPGCLEQGYTLHQCTICGNRYEDNFTDPVGHSWDNGTVTLRPTEQSPGEITYVCRRCWATRVEVLPKIDHEHSYRETTYPPTCTEQGYTVFSCPCGKVYVDHYVVPLGHDFQTHICARCGAERTGNPFVDVKDTDFFYAPVLWAVRQGITNGTSETNFSPDRACTRGQVVTFLWRAYGSPEPEGSENPFADVDPTAYYYKAVLWAVEKGITTGTSAEAFSPDRSCTRGQVATFLWRAQGRPTHEDIEAPFSDVKEADYFYDAVLWAVEANITKGTGQGRFSPDRSCTRGQIVTFLYRAMNSFTPEDQYLN